MNSNDRFIYRYELKYSCPFETMTVLENRIRSVMDTDSHADANGEYLIRSVYFDDWKRSCYYDNEDGVDPRAKFRIRTYNYSDDYISLEKKIKNKGMTRKESCVITKQQCMQMLNSEDISSLYGQSQVLDEWCLKHETEVLRPVMLGEYVRKPYIYSVGNVRITFDYNISASPEITSLFKKDISKISLQPTRYCILEVKYDGFLPDIIYKLLDAEHLIPTAFSKFYIGCKALGGNI